MLLLRHGSLPPVPQLTAEMGVKIDSRVLGDIDVIGKDFCLTFNLYTEKINAGSRSGNILCFPSKTYPPPGTCMFSVYNKNGPLIIYHRFAKNRRESELTVTPKPHEWINLKITQMRTNVEPGEYKFKVLVNDVMESEMDLDESDLEDVRSVSVGLGRGIVGQLNNHVGLVHGLFVNGKQFL